MEPGADSRNSFLYICGECAEQNEIKGPRDTIACRACGRSRILYKKRTRSSK